MSVTKIADTIYTFRFLRLLTMKWKSTPAYKLGIVDEEGTPLKKSSELNTPEEKSAYTLFHRLVFKIRRVIQKIPFGKTAFASYAAALFLIKENCSEEQFDDILNSLKESGHISNKLNESKAVNLDPGVYKVIAEEVIMPSTCEPIKSKGEEVILEENSEPAGNLLGVNIYKVRHKATNQYVYVSQEDIAK
jgi:hypothetical protein